MKITTVFLILMAVSSSTFAGNKNQAKHKMKDSHSSIYTQKITDIANAINVGRYTNEKDYLEMLATACKRNRCSAIEKDTIQSVGQQIIHCKIKHLKAHGIDNSEATMLCQSKQAMLGCDSLATPLLRKMCYTGNRYSLQTLNQKEKSMKSRLPASAQ